MSITQTNINQAADMIVPTSCAGAAGYYVGTYGYATINPVYGAAFCVASTLISKVASTVFEDFNINSSKANNSARLLNLLLVTAVGGGIAAFATVAAGVALSAKTAAFLAGSALLASEVGPKVATKLLLDRI